MMRKLYAVVFAALLLGACAERQQEAAREGTEAAAARESRTEFERTMEARLNELDRKMNELEADMKNAPAATRARISEEWNKLGDERQQARAKLNDMKTATDDGWERFKDDVQAAVDDLERGYNRVLESMKTDNR